MDTDTIGILVTARLGSTRLKRKHLLEAGGRPFLHWLLWRIQGEFASELASGRAVVVIATTPEPDNEAFKAFEGQGVTVFAGSKGNIPLRHLQAAQALKLAAIVSVDGDDVLCAPEAMRAVYDGLAQGAPGVKTEGLPFGMNAWGYAADMLAASLEGHHGEQLETGWGRIFDFDRFDTATFTVPGNSDAVRLTLDYAEDADLFRAVIEGLGPCVAKATAGEIVGHMLENDLTRLNATRVEEYWANFNSEREQESASSAEKA